MPGLRCYPTFQGKPPWKEGPAVVAGSLEGFSGEQPCVDGSGGISVWCSQAPLPCPGAFSPLLIPNLFLHAQVCGLLVSRDKAASGSQSRDLRLSCAGSASLSSLLWSLAEDFPPHPVHF